MIYATKYSKDIQPILTDTCDEFTHTDVGEDSLSQVYYSKSVVFVAYL